MVRSRNAATIPRTSPRCTSSCSRSRDAKIVEEKTSDPANYPIIGVEDPTQPGAAGAEISSPPRTASTPSSSASRSARATSCAAAGEVKSYSVAPSDLGGRRAPGLDRCAAHQRSGHFDPERRAQAGGGRGIRASPREAQRRRQRFTHRGNAGGPQAARIRSRQCAARRRCQGARALESGASTRAEDVATASDIDFSKPTQAILTLSDGNVLTLTGTAAGDKRWIEVQATKDATLTAKTQNRAFEVASYRYDAIFRPLDQLLVPKETKPPAGIKPAGRSLRRGKSVPGTEARRSVQVTRPLPLLRRRRDQRDQRRLRAALCGAGLRFAADRGAAHGVHRRRGPDTRRCRDPE